MMRLLMILSILHIIHGFVIDEPSEVECRKRIVGGTNADHGEFPYQILFLYKKRFRCGGFIVNKSFAVTAAHCPLNINWTELEVVAGEHNLQKNDGTEQVRKVVKVISHNYSSYTFENDIALLKVDPPFNFNKYVRPVALPVQGQFTVGCCVVAGWGRIGYYKPISNILQKVYIPVVSDEICRKLYEGVFKIADSMMCAGPLKGGKGICFGDSGSALVCNGYVAGITSWTNGCASPNFPDGYTEVSYFVDWIKQNIN